MKNFFLNHLKSSRSDPATTISRIKDSLKISVAGWSMGMILASGARGPILFTFFHYNAKFEFFEDLINISEET